MTGECRGIRTRGGIEKEFELDSGPFRGRDRRRDGPHKR